MTPPTPEQQRRGWEVSGQLTQLCERFARELHDAAHAAVPDALECPILVVLAEFEYPCPGGLALGVTVKGEQARVIAALEQALMLARKSPGPSTERDVTTVMDLPATGPTVH